MHDGVQQLPHNGFCARVVRVGSSNPLLPVGNRTRYRSLKSLNGFSVVTLRRLLRHPSELPLSELLLGSHLGGVPRRVLGHMPALDRPLEVSRELYAEALLRQFDVGRDALQERPEVATSHRRGQIQHEPEIFLGDIRLFQEGLQRLRRLGLSFERRDLGPQPFDLGSKLVDALSRSR